ncbi:type IV pili methyl-accepting chemotaxis transducer N-terminal domain-containing protein, partial [Arhodomonas sp. KWT]
MAREDNRQASTGLRRVADLLTVVAALAIVAMIAAFALVAHYGDIDRAYISRADSVRVQSQKIAKNALEAANGKTDAFAELGSGRDALQANIDDLVEGVDKVGLPPTAQASDEASAALGKVVRVWRQMREEVNAILDRREMVVRANVVAERFRVLLPQIQESAADLADGLAGGGGSARQAALAAELNTVAERIGRNLSGMVRGGFGNTGAARRLEDASDRFGRIIDGLSQGSEALGVSPVTGENARSAVSAIASDFEEVRSSVDELLSQSPELFRVRDAADGIYTLSEQVLATGQQLTGAYRDLSGSRWVQPWMPYALGALALIVLIVRGAV